MAQIQFGDEVESVVTREEWPLEKARATLKNETIAIIGYGVQGPGQALNLRDNGFNVIVGQRKGGKTWEKAVADGWVEGKTLFEIEEAASRGTIIQYLLSDAAQMELWPTLKPHLTAGKALYFSHGFAITFQKDTGVVPPKDVNTLVEKLKTQKGIVIDQQIIPGANHFFDGKLEPLMETVTGYLDMRLANVR